MEYPNSTLPYPYPNPTPSLHYSLTYPTLPCGDSEKIRPKRPNLAETTQGRNDTGPKQSGSKPIGASSHLSPLTLEIVGAPQMTLQ